MVNTCVRVLLVEDDLDHAALTRAALLGADRTQFEVQDADCLAAARNHLRASDFDVVLLDLGLPDARDFDALSGIREQSPEMSIVVLTANNDSTVGMAALVRGAQDYLYKGDLSSHTLERVIRHAVQRQQMLLQLQSANELLDQKNTQLQSANELLDQKNTHLAQLYRTAYQFVDDVSHEFRTPLTVIKEFVSLMRDGLAGQTTEDQREFLDIVNDRTDDLVTMVDDMLDVSKLEAGLLSVWRRETGVGDIIQHACSTLERKALLKNVMLETALEEDLPAVYCDPEKIGRVIINLVTNAIKFCGEGGCVKLRAKRKADSPEVLFSVADDGPGISPENLKLIFDRFKQVEGATRSSTKGFGLGLSIAKELVSLNFGTIHVESTPRKGSTFSFTVPVYEPSEFVLRYLQRIERLGNGATYITLVLAKLSPPVEADVADTVDELLQHLFRADDLVIRALPHKWIVIAKCHHHEVHKMIQRVRRAWVETSRNRPEGKLPDIDLRAKDTWRVETQAEEFIQECQKELRTQEEAPPAPRVLLVDDDRELLRGLGIRLTAAGFDVLTAPDGEEGVKLATEHHPDAILMDNYMPVMDGLEALRQLNEHPDTRKIPVVMLTASRRDQEALLQQGARFFLQKPCVADNVVAALRQAMAHPVLRSGT